MTVITIIDDAMSYIKDDNGNQARLCHELLDDAVWKYVGGFNNGISKNIIFCLSHKNELTDNEKRKSIYDTMRFDIAKQVARYYQYYAIQHNYITKPISVASRIACLIIMAIEAEAAVNDERIEKYNGKYTVIESCGVTTI